ncbi:phospholipase D-like domain-containing protein [Tunturiibacter lichenicola]|uniref:phospholipase D-like domain-containing protein n=1 Tax=Tunturiibacter lichenicola TaxID=2051959 RepID=UPI0021B18783|nr:phospholipase D-like domain-containing protein [Edaphobacter lichenicola]
MILKRFSRLTARVVFVAIAVFSAGLPSVTSGQTATPAAPQASLGAATPFPDTTVGTTSAVQTVTLTNTGSSSLTISSIKLTGKGRTAFVQSNTCGTSLDAGANCVISVSFKPAAKKTYDAAISVTDNASGRLQKAALKGKGAAVSTAPTLTLISFPQSDLSVTPLYQFIQTATSTIDMTMYELVDTTFQQDLVALAAKGIQVRVILDQALEKTNNTPAFTYLNANGVPTVWANPVFQASHQKTITLDGKTSAIMTLNLTSQYYSTSRDFAVIDTNASDVAAIETTFNSDFTSAAITPPLGNDLVWSPTNAQPALIALIGAAKISLNVENEEMADPAIAAALSNAAKNGVKVQVTMTANTDYTTEFNTLKAAGVQIHTYAQTAPLYIHAKVILVDAGQSGQQAFVGSENFSNASLTENRELGLILTDAAILNALNTTLSSDFAGGTAF